MLHSGKYLSDSELQAWHAKCDLTNRNHVIIALALATGARAQEVLNITRDDLNKASCSVLIRGLKGSNDREIPLRPELFEAAYKCIPFEIGYERLKQVWYKHRTANKPFKCTRHTFAINLLRKTKDAKLVQTALGHKSSSSTDVYTRYVFTMDEMRKALL